jgi:hypothetical protein
MSKPLASRIWFALTAVAVIAGVVVQLIVTAGSSGNGFFTENPQRTLNVFAFFTIQSNLILGVICLLLALEPDRRRSTLFRTLRLNGVLCIAVTGIVYHLALARLDELTGAAAVANLLVHTVTPLLGVLGWLIFGPRGQTDARIVAWSLVFPVAWLVFTLVRGEYVGFYPYPFLNVTDHGYPTVLVNSLLVAALFLGLAAGLTALDRAMVRNAASIR